MRILLLSIALASTLLSQTTICYKENSTLSKINNTILLDSGECNGKNSIKTMENNGWKIKYSQVTKKNSKYNHLVIFDKTTKTKVVKQNIIPKHNFNTKMQKFTVSNVNKNIATVNKGNLKVGQSGIVIHKYSDGKSIIVANATVLNSSQSSSKLILEDDKFLTQNAIPTSNVKVSSGDIFILNHLYSSSLLIVPNHETSQLIKKVYPKQNFMNPDIFASHLKVTNTPIPTKEFIQDFCKTKDLGTIFIAVQDRFYILDVNSFKVLDTINISVKDTSVQQPFFTKVVNIEKNFWDFGDSKIADYNSFYSSLVNNTEYVPTEITSSDNEDEKSLLDKVKEILPW